MIPQKIKDQHSIPATERMIKQLMLARYIGSVPAGILAWAGAVTAVLIAVNQFADLLIKLHIL